MKKGSNSFKVQAKDNDQNEEKKFNDGKWYQNFLFRILQSF